MVIEVGKVKFREGQEPERWRIEGRTVLHQSWAGWTWRKKGSSLEYTEGCGFGPPPPPPPPPPPQVRYVVRFKTRVVFPLRFFSVYAAKYVDNQLVTYGVAPEASVPAVYPIVGWTVVALSYSDTSLFKHYRATLRRPDGGVIYADVAFQDNWNGQADPGGDLLDEETLVV